MARTYEAIKSEIQTTIRTYPSLNAFLFPEEGGSAVAVHNLIIATVAQAILTFEAIVDSAKAALQAISDTIPAGNSSWLQKQILNFQYGDVIGFVNDVPLYNPVDPTHRIITQCSVKQLSSGIVALKVAKGSPPGPLSGPELTALSDYYYGTSTTEGIGFAGVRVQLISLDADRIRVQANIYFFGQYTQAVVSASVIIAINNFLSVFSLDSFDGTIFMKDLKDIIEGVAGVSRVEFTSIKARANTNPLISAVDVDFQGFYSTFAGYVISEDTLGNTLADTLIFIQETA